MPLHEWTPSQRRNEQGEIEEYQKDLRTWLFEEESFVPLALFQDGKAYSIVTDHLGTPVEAYNEKGEEVWYRRLDMNGKVIEERSMLYTSYKDYIKIPFLFQGQYYDEEIKLAYNRFRYYAPELGRYISEDPIGFASGALALHSYVEDVNCLIDILGLAVTLFQIGTYGSLRGGGESGLQAHELMRHKYLQDKGLAGINRLSGNPSIALDAIHHRLKPQVGTQGGAHYHETQIRRNLGLRSNQFHPSHKRELDIVQGALRKAGIPASVARRLRKEADMFYGNLLKQEKKSTYK